MAFAPHTSEAFAQHIEHAVKKYKMTYLDAVIHFCEQRKLEPESIVPYLSTKMKTAMSREGQALHLLRPRRELPFDD
jgi:hypothetical protein